MTTQRILILVSAVALALLILVIGQQIFEQGPIAPALEEPATIDEGGESFSQGFLQGRITTMTGSTYEGRLRWGGDEEALWIHYFKGFKAQNSWANHVPNEWLYEPSEPLEILGIEVPREKKKIDLTRPFRVRFGDIARIQAEATYVGMTLKSGATFLLDRFAANELDDGIRIWDPERGLLDLESLKIRTLEFRPEGTSGNPTEPLYGSVHTQHGIFTGFVRWNRMECLGSDELNGKSTDGALSLRFDTIRSIARHPEGGSLVQLIDGTELVLTHTQDVDEGNRGLFVEDPRYGRVLISWQAFERIEFSRGMLAPTYEDFPPGEPLVGRVTTRQGRHFTGRLVYDLDESETTETLDASLGGVSYAIPFGRVASIKPEGSEGCPRQRACVSLSSGEELQLEPNGDLGEQHAGMLVFVEEREAPEYIPWVEVVRIDFEPSRTQPLAATKFQARTR